MNNIQTDTKLREALNKFNGAGAHACYCGRSTDKGCECALKDEYVDEVMKLIQAYVNKAVVEELEHLNIESYATSPRTGHHIAYVPDNHKGIKTIEARISELKEKSHHE